MHADDCDDSHPLEELELRWASDGYLALVRTTDAVRRGVWGDIQQLVLRAKEGWKRARKAPELSRSCLPSGRPAAVPVSILGGAAAGGSPVAWARRRKWAGRGNYLGLMCACVLYRQPCISYAFVLCLWLGRRDGQ